MKDAIKLEMEKCNAEKQTDWKLEQTLIAYYSSNNN